jgi:transposase
MQTVTTIGLDIAKSVLHGVDAAGQVVTRRQLKRRFVLSFFEKLPPCLVGIEACASLVARATEAAEFCGICCCLRGDVAVCATRPAA